MLKRFLLLLLVCATQSSVLWAQSTPLIRQLENKRSDLQKQIAEKETILKTTKKDVGSQMKALSTLTGQIEERKRYIADITGDVALLDRELIALQRQLVGLQNDLKEKKNHYASSVKYLRSNRSIQDKLMFIFSAQNLAQTYRRLRYVQEYATFQRIQGEEIKRKQEEVTAKRRQVESAKASKQKLLEEREREKTKLEGQEKEKQKLISNLRKKQRAIQNEVAKKRKESQQLNARIDRLIAQEVEKARKRAEEEARKKNAASRKSGGKTPAKSTGSYTLSKEDVALSSDFAGNRGRLPMPITGPYIITGQFGEHTVEGLSYVKLDNKGIDIQGKQGAQARAIFNGKVTAVLRLGDGLFGVLVRHGGYFSVYTNLSSVSVKQGADVSTKQVLGTVFSDKSDNGRTVLHFQLRKGKEKLNPMLWLNR